MSGSTTIETRPMSARTSGSRTLPSPNVAMPTRPSISAAAAENSPENLASSPFFGSEWIRMFGTARFTPMTTEAICEGWSACVRRSSSAPSMIEWVQAQDGYGLTATPVVVIFHGAPSVASAAGWRRPR